MKRSIALLKMVIVFITLVRKWNRILASQDLPLFSDLKALILSLAKKTSAYTNDDTARLYGESEWKELCSYSGPTESIAECTCKTCNKKSYAIGTSGFLDIIFFINANAKSVIVEDSYKNTKPPANYYVPSDKCPFCGGTISQEWGISPYVFFQEYKLLSKII